MLFTSVSWWILCCRLWWSCDLPCKMTAAVLVMIIAIIHNRMLHSSLWIHQLHVTMKGARSKEQISNFIRISINLLQGRISKLGMHLSNSAYPRDIAARTKFLIFFPSQTGNTRVLIKKINSSLSECPFSMIKLFTLNTKPGVTKYTLLSMQS